MDWWNSRFWSFSIDTLNKILLIALGLFGVGCQSDSRKTSAESNVVANESRADGSHKNDVKTQFWVDRKVEEKKLKALLVKVKKDPSNPELYVELAEISFFLKKIALGRAACKSSLKNKPGFAPALLACAKIEFADDNVALAELTLDKLPKALQQKAEVLELRALISYKNKDFNNAAVLYSKAAKLDPKDLRLQLNAGLLHLHQYQIHQAKVFFDRALKIDEGNHVALFHSGIVFSAMRELDKAKKAFDAVVEDQEFGALARFHLARLYVESGELALAAENIKDVKTESSDFSEKVAKLSTSLRTFISLDKNKMQNEKLKKEKVRANESKSGGEKL